MKLFKRLGRISMRLAVLWIALLTMTRQHVVAQSFPANFAGVQLATGLDPVSLDVAPDGRIFITEKIGKVRIVKNGSLLSNPFLTIPNVDNYNERGLLGIALDPDFSNNKYVYVYYTYKPGNNNRVSRFTADGDVAVAGSEQVLLDIDPLSSSGVHNGGGLFFRDGKLFILVGENANGQNAQSLSTLKGKVLRINTDGSIPSDNPFFGSLSGNLRAIWALGLRNPFKGSAQPGTDRLYINDVGQNTFEEINQGIAGKNYGWPAIEGVRGSQAPPANYQDPVYAYNHSQGCSITAGAFYNPSTAQFPASYVGKYFYADYCNGWIKTLDPDNGTVATFATGVNRPLDIKVGNDGTFYFIARGGIAGGSEEANTSSNNGVLWKVNYTGSGRPVIAVQPSDKTVAAGGSATFSVNASGSPAPSYQWQRNQVDIAGATSASYTVSSVALSDNGAKFRVILSNASGTIISNEATLTVNTNQKPVAKITTPGLGATYSGGDVINFSGTGTDAEDGALPASAFSWRVDLYHYDTPAHFHPALEPFTGRTSGSFSIPISGETSPNVLFRIYLTVTDSKGATSTDVVDVNPIRSKITLETNPSGLGVKLDGRVVTAPFSFTGVSKIERSLEATSSQSVGSSVYTFHSWSDGGAANHTISTPSTDYTYTANYIRSADNPSNVVSGLEYTYVEGGFDALPNFNATTPVKTGNTPNIDLSLANRNDDYAFRFKGFIDVPTDGKYTFYTNSDDGSKLYIADVPVVDNDGQHSAREVSGSIYLKAGKHPITISFFERGGDQLLTASYEGPGISKQTIPASAFFRTGTISASDDIYEAETANLSGVQGSTLHPGYTGTAFADFISGSQEYIEWTINVPTAGSYTLAFRYGLVADAGRPLEIKVNESVVSPSLAFPPTPTWTDWQYVSVPVALAAGTNKVRATAIGSSGANIDHLKVSANASGRIGTARSGELFLYPNPVGDYLQLATLSGETPIHRVEIVNLQGQKVLASVPEGGRVDVSRLGMGTYMVRVISGDQIRVFKVVKR